MPDSGSERSDGRDRLPRDQIPDDLTCQLCDPQVTLKNVAGYQGHMAVSHHIFFEQPTKEDIPVHWRNRRDAVPEDPAQLPVWMKVAIVRHELYGESWERIATEIGKAAETLRIYNKTPAAKKVKEEIGELTDIKSIVKVMMESASLHMYADWLMALEWAKAAKDHKMVHTMIKDIGLQPILQEARQQNVAPTTLILNLASADLKTIEAKTSYVVDAIVEPDDVD